MNVMEGTYLRDIDSCNFFKKAGGHIITCPYAIVCYCWRLYQKDF